MASNSVIGRVASLWRYPVKSMRGEELTQAFAGFGGVFGDRFYSILSANASARFPYLTGRDKETMVLYTPSFRHAERMQRPSNLTEAESGFGLTAQYPDEESMTVDVVAPSGERFVISDPRLLESLRTDRHPYLTLRHSHRAMTDCRPISLVSSQTVRRLTEELGFDFDPRRLRENFYLDLNEGEGFAEDAFVGRTLQIGEKAQVHFVGRDGRCKMITLDPDTGEANPEIMKHVAAEHEGRVGIYGAVIVEGTVFPGDEVTVVGSGL